PTLSTVILSVSVLLDGLNFQSPTNGLSAAAAVDMTAQANKTSRRRRVVPKLAIIPRKVVAYSVTPPWTGLRPLIRQATNQNLAWRRGSRARRQGAPYLDETASVEMGYGRKAPQGRDAKR